MSIKGSPEWEEHALHPEKSDTAENRELQGPPGVGTGGEPMAAVESPGMRDPFVEGTVEDRPIGMTLETDRDLHGGDDRGVTGPHRP